MNRARNDVAAAPFWGLRVTLGRVCAAGTVTYVKTREMKRAALQQALQDMAAGAVFFVAWTGAHSTDIFNVTAEDVARWISEEAERPSGVRSP